MKSKLCVMGMAVLIAAAFMVLAGCSQEAQAQEVVVVDTSRANEPSNVRVEKLSYTKSETAAAYVVVTWNAAENASGYRVCYQIDGAKDITTVTGTFSTATGTGITNRYRWSSADGPLGENTDPDRYSCFLLLSGFATPYLWNNVRFGVQTTGSLDMGSSANGPSAIVWQSGTMSL